MAKVRYQEMLPHEIVAAREACPIAYVPIGGVEWHGEHLAVGNDTLKADILAVRCAEAGGGLAMPALYWGEPREAYLMDANAADRELINEKMHLPPENFASGYMRRSVHDTDRAYIELLLYICRQLKSLGFRVITFLAGHYPIVRHAKAAVEWFNLEGGAVAWACSGYELVKEEIPWAGDHAGKWETSLLMALRPDCVDLEHLPTDPDVPLVGATQTATNDPRGANLQEGQAGVEAVVGAITREAHRLLPPQ